MDVSTGGEPMDKDKLNDMVQGLGQRRQRKHAFWTLIEQGVHVDLETGELRWPPNYK